MWKRIPGTRPEGLNECILGLELRHNVVRGAKIRGKGGQAQV